MLLKKRIRLFWWNEIRIQGKSKENYGDLLGKYLVEKISNQTVTWTKPSKFSFYDFIQPIYVTVGSILANVNYKCVVWGSGIINKDQTVKKAKFIAVRGPQTRQALLKQDYNVPKIYGDPALLLPRYFNPKIEKSYTLGVIPHYQDYKDVSSKLNNNSILLIDLMTNSVEETTKEILKCKAIVSSSLHGVIVSHAYGIPAVWQPFSDKLYGDGIKFQDYFESVGIPPYRPDIIEDYFDLHHLKCLFNDKPILPNTTIVENLCDGLMAVCPFKA